MLKEVREAPRNGKEYLIIKQKRMSSVWRDFSLSRRSAGAGAGLHLS